MFSGLLRPAHLLVILIVCIVVFGPRRLPELGKALGDGIRGLKGGLGSSPKDDKTNQPTTSAK